MQDIIRQVAPEARIIDYRIKQQWNGYDCGALTVDNLIKMANNAPIRSNLNQNSSEIVGLQLR